MHTNSKLRILTSAVLLIALTSCGSPDKKEEAVAQPMPDEISLKEDRAELDELRKDMSSDVKQENDEVAFILKNMAGMEEEPSKVRDRFQTAVRKRREKMDKNMRKEREDYSANERKSRETFLRELQDEREKKNTRKLDQRDRKRFFDDQDARRREYFATSTEKRKDFEASISERRKKFEDYFREQTNKFNQEHRAYTEAYNERRKALELKKKMEQKEQRLKREESRTTGLSPAQPQSGGKANNLPPGMTEEDAVLLEEMAKHKATGKIQPLRTGSEDK